MPFKDRGKNNLFFNWLKSTGFMLVQKEIILHKQITCCNVKVLFLYLILITTQRVTKLMHKLVSMYFLDIHVFQGCFEKLTGDHCANFRLSTSSLKLRLEFFSIGMHTILKSQQVALQRFRMEVLIVKRTSEKLRKFVFG